MVRVIRGAGGLVHFEPLDGELLLDLSEPRATPMPWAGARRLLERLGERFGEEAVAGAIRPHRAAVSLILPELIAELTADERRDRAALSASCPSLLFYPNLNPWPPAEAFAGVVAELTRNVRVAVVAENVRAMDVESLRLIRPLRRRTMGHGNTRFLLGVDTRFEPQGRVARLADEMGMLEMRRIEAIEGTVTEEANAAGAPREIEAVTEESSLRAVCQSFDAYGFGYAFDLAERFLELNPPADEAAEAHAIAAVCAHQLRATGEAEVQQAAARHRAAALTSPDGPGRFPHLVCRQVIQEAGAKNFARARELAETVLTLSRSGDLRGGLAPYAAVWGLNARAFVEFRSGDMARASATVNEALELTGRCMDPSPGIPELHIQLTRYYLCGNMTQVMTAAGDERSAALWLERTDRMLEAMPEAQRPAFGGLSAAVAVAHLDAAADDLEASRAKARAGLSPEGEARYSLALAGVEYRRGAAAAAYRHFERAREIQTILRAPDEDLLPTILNTAFAALRAGRYEDALRLFGDLTADAAKLAVESRAEILAVRALCAARLGDREMAGALTTEALELREHPEIPVDARLRTARWAGEALADATLLEAALREAVGSDAVAVTDRVGLLVALIECNGGGTDRVRQTVGLIPTALAEDDANLWWEFPRLLRHVDEAMAAAAADCELAAALDTLLSAAGERADCAELLQTLLQPA